MEVAEALMNSAQDAGTELLKLMMEKSDEWFPGAEDNMKLPLLNAALWTAFKGINVPRNEKLTANNIEKYETFSEEFIGDFIGMSMELNQFEP